MWLSMVSSPISLKYHVGFHRALSWDLSCSLFMLKALVNIVVDRFKKNQNCAGLPV